MSSQPFLLRVFEYSEAGGAGGVHFRSRCNQEKKPGKPNGTVNMAKPEVRGQADMNCDASCKVHDEEGTSSKTPNVHGDTHPAGGGPRTRAEARAEPSAAPGPVLPVTGPETSPPQSPQPGPNKKSVPTFISQDRK